MQYLLSLFLMYIIRVLYTYNALILIIRELVGIRELARNLLLSKISMSIKGSKGLQYTNSFSETQFKAMVLSV